jgi:hypothetical protein
MSSTVQLDQLGKQNTRWAAAEQQRPAASLQGHTLDTMGGARSRLNKNCFECWKVTDLMD